jgi:hypothetical protein
MVPGGFPLRGKTPRGNHRPCPPPLGRAVTRRLLTFEVYRSRYPRSDFGERYADIEAASHRAAKQLAAEQHPGIQVVVLPSSAGRARSHVPTSPRTLP